MKTVRFLCLKYIFTLFKMLIFKTKKIGKAFFIFYVLIDKAVRYLIYFFHILERRFVIIKQSKVLIPTVKKSLQKLSSIYIQF